MKTGISLYLSNGMEKNEAIIDQAERSGIGYAFTSLHIPEEAGVEDKTEVPRLFKRCGDAGINCIVDISPASLGKLGCRSFDELANLGITYVRLDFGFHAREVVAISKKFHVVFNASAVSLADIQSWRVAGADFTRFSACHNYYPKPYTGLSLARVKEINQNLRTLGFTTMAFVPGDGELRGPIYEGLPTVEHHRFAREDVLFNMLELYQADSDIVLVGDNTVTEKAWTQLKSLGAGHVSLQATLLPGYEFERDRIHHDRPDSSEYVIRSQESRFHSKSREILPDRQVCRRTAGSVCIANKDYKRYMGELEIARTDMPGDPRINVIGQIAEEDRKYLPYIRNGLGFHLCPAASAL